MDLDHPSSDGLRIYVDTGGTNCAACVRFDEDPINGLTPTISSAIAFGVSRSSVSVFRVGARGQVKMGGKPGEVQAAYLDIGTNTLNSPGMPPVAFLRIATNTVIPLWWVDGTSTAVQQLLFGSSISFVSLYSTGGGGVGLNVVSGSFTFVKANQIEGNLGTVGQSSGKILTLDAGAETAASLKIGSGNMGFLSQTAGTDVGFTNNTRIVHRIYNAGQNAIGFSPNPNDGKSASLVVTTMAATSGSGQLPLLHLVSSQPITSVGHEALEVNGSSIVVGVPFWIGASTQMIGTSNGPSNVPTAFSFLVSTLTYPQNISTATLAVAVSTTGYVVFGSSAVVPHQLSGCGSSPTIYGGGNAFTITPGATAGGCTITFGTPFNNPPIPHITQRNPSLVNALSYTVTTTALVLTETSFSSVTDIFLAPPTQ